MERKREMEGRRTRGRRRGGVRLEGGAERGGERGITRQGDGDQEEVGGSYGSRRCTNS